jgi:hypothetical protein
MKQQYNGWTNYETWHVAISLSQSVESWRFWLDQAKEQAQSATHAGATEGTAAARATQDLADKIAEHVRQTESGKQQSAAQLAVTEVNWQELARDLLARVLPTTIQEGPAQPDDSDWLRSIFATGELVITPAALAALSQWEILDAFFRHERGDWGAVCADDWAENQFSLKEHLRLFSVYLAADGTKFWVITEADRSVTTVLLPSDY